MQHWRQQQEELNWSFWPSMRQEKRVLPYTRQKSYCLSLQQQHLSGIWEIPLSVCMGLSTWGTEEKMSLPLPTYSCSGADLVVVWATTVGLALAGEPRATGNSGDERPPSSLLLKRHCKTVAGQGDQLKMLPGYCDEQVWWISGIIALNKGNEIMELMFSGWKRNIWSWHGFLWGGHAHRTSQASPSEGENICGNLC